MQVRKNTNSFLGFSSKPNNKTKTMNKNQQQIQFGTAVLMLLQREFIRECKIIVIGLTHSQKVYFLLIFACCMLFFSFETFLEDILMED